MYDAVIVGACTAGTYFASLLAKRGLKVLVIDRDAEENLAKRLDIVHFTRDSYEEFGVEPSVAGDEEFVHDYHVCYGKSALNNHLKTNYINVAVLHLPLFIKRLRKNAIEAGAQFQFGTAFRELYYENGRIAGIITADNETIPARLGKRKIFVSCGHIIWGFTTILFGMTEYARDSQIGAPGEPLRHRRGYGAADTGSPVLRKQGIPQARWLSCHNGLPG